MEESRVSPNGVCVERPAEMECVSIVCVRLVWTGAKLHLEKTGQSCSAEML